MLGTISTIPELMRTGGLSSMTTKSPSSIYQKMRSFKGSSQLKIVPISSSTDCNKANDQ